MNKETQTKVLEGYFGLEKESLRIRRADGLLAQTAHPFPDDPQLTKDFCESQLEIVTPVCRSTDDLYRTVALLNQKAALHLSKRGELLWNYSNPPAIYSEREIKTAVFRGPDREKEAYRNHLKEKYGVWKMLLSGIHYNYSFSEEAEKVISKQTAQTREELYLKLAVCSMKYAWLITYLTAASPLIDPTYRGPITDAASLRCSSSGYWNDFIPVLNYDSVKQYIQSIEDLVDQGKLYSPWEMYLPVRLKPRGENTLDNLNNGISHIELRMLDLNPLYAEGINIEDLHFLHYLLLYFAFQPKPLFGGEEQKAAVRNMQNAAKRDDANIWIEQSEAPAMPVREATLNYLADMEAFYEPWQNAEILRVIEYQKRKLLVYCGRYADIILKQQKESAGLSA